MRLLVLAAALAGAVVGLGDPAGIGVACAALLVLAAGLAAGGRTRDAALFGPLAAGLAATAVLRDAGWLVALDLAAAWAAACLAVGGPRLAALVAPAARLPGLPALVPPLPRGSAPAVRGALLSAAVTVPFGVLFWSADAAFAELLARAPLPGLDSLAGRTVAFGLAGAAAGTLALAARRPPGAVRGGEGRRLSPWEWGVPLALLDALFLAFVAVQVAVLFGGRDHVLETAGLTYAEYARAGFWQLLAAGALTLLVVGALVRAADAPRPRDRLALRLLLGLLGALTLVVLASALRRLDLYEEAFGLTRLRLGAVATALWIGAAVVVAVAAATVPRIRSSVPRVALAGSLAALLLFSLANPDRIVAERNVERWRSGGGLDVAYLGTLSADAAPALAALPEPLRARALAPLAGRIERDEPWTSYNLSRARARAILR